MLLWRGHGLDRESEIVHQIQKINTDKKKKKERFSRLKVIPDCPFYFFLIPLPAYLIMMSVCQSRNQVVSRIFSGVTKERVCEDIIPSLHDVVVEEDLAYLPSQLSVNGLSSC